MQDKGTEASTSTRPVGQDTSANKPSKGTGTNTGEWPYSNVSIGDKAEFEHLTNRLIELETEGRIMRSKRDRMIRAMLHSFDAGREPK